MGNSASLGVVEFEIGLPELFYLCISRLNRSRANYRLVTWSGATIGGCPKYANYTLSGPQFIGQHLEIGLSWGILAPHKNNFAFGGVAF